MFHKNGGVAVIFSAILPRQHVQTSPKSLDFSAFWTHIPPSCSRSKSLNVTRKRAFWRVSFFLKAGIRGTCCQMQRFGKPRRRWQLSRVYRRHSRTAPCSPDQLCCGRSLQSRVGARSHSPCRAVVFSVGWRLLLPMFLKCSITGESQAGPASISQQVFARRGSPACLSVAPSLSLFRIVDNWG